MKNKKENLDTGVTSTWCPGCYNFRILAGVKKYFSSELEKGKRKEDFGICSGIGCQGKIFDYINLNGINTLHGRELPTAFGMKIGNPKLDVYTFIGDGGCYNEGISHLINAARRNIDITCIVHNNQIFALTVGQPTAVTEKGFSDKTLPESVNSKPLNPLKLVLNSNGSFVARVFADAKQIEWILNEAKKHKGFKFIEVLQPCITLHPDKDYVKFMHQIDKEHDVTDFNAAMKLAMLGIMTELKKGIKFIWGFFIKKKDWIFWEIKQLIHKSPC